MSRVPAQCMGKGRGGVGGWGGGGVGGWGWGLQGVTSLTANHFPR